MAPQGLTLSANAHKTFTHPTTSRTRLPPNCKPMRELEARVPPSSAILLGGLWRAGPAARQVNHLPLDSPRSLGTIPPDGGIGGAGGI